MVEVEVKFAGAPGVTNGRIVELLKKEGDEVRAEEPIARIEAAKMVIDVPAPASGRLKRVLRREGEVINVGDVIAIIEA